jgi:hypothetical protein
MHKLALNPHSAHNPIRGTERAAWSRSYAYKRSNVWAQTERCQVSKGSRINVKFCGVLERANLSQALFPATRSFISRSSCSLNCQVIGPYCVRT